MIQPQHLDFGEREVARAFVWKAPLENTTDQPLEVLSMNTSCGCTKVAPEAFTIPPRGAQELELTLDLAPTRASNAFQVPRPPRTWVRGEAEGLQYIVRADGSRRTILAEELARGATHWDLLDSEPSQAALPAAGASGTEPLLTGMDYAIGALILAGLGVCFAAARRRKSPAARVGSEVLETKE